MSDTLIIGVVACLLAAIVVFVMKQQRDKKLSAAVRAMKAENAAARRYQFLSTFFLTQGRMVYIGSALSSLSVYKAGRVAVMSVRYFMASLALQAVIVAVGALLFGDIFSIMTCIVLAMLAGHITIDREIEKINLRVYREMSQLISSVRQEYLRTYSIPEALTSIVPSSLMARPVAQIEDILTSTNGEEMMLKFYESSPFRMLQTFATVCFNINNTGDEIDAVTGHSRFLDSLSLMASDVNSEIHRLALTWQKFHGLVYLPLIPLVGTPITQIFLKSAMPGTAVIYDGMAGFICNFVTLLLTAISFHIVALMSKSTTVSEDDRIPAITNAYEKYPGLRRFIMRIAPKNAARRAQVRKQDAALSRKTPELMAFERLLFLGVGLVSGALLLFVSLTAGRDYLLHSTQNMGIVKDTALDEFDVEQVLALDNAYLTRDVAWSDEEMSARINAALPGLSSMDIGEQVKRLKDKEAALKQTELQWWHLLLVYGLAVGFSCIPLLLRAMRKWSAQSAAEEDFLQLQSLMAIIMSMGVDTLDALEQLCTNSRIHRVQLLYAYHSYPAHPDKELDRLGSKVTLPEFKRFIEKLKLTVADLSLAEAFSDLLLEREHMVRMREMATINAIDRRRHLAGMLAQIPLGAMVFLEMLLPIAYLGVKEFSGALGSLGGL